MQINVPKNREDIFFKLAYARGALGGNLSNWQKVCYLEHLWHWNKFYESDQDGTKNGLKDYELSFQNLASSFLHTGFRSDLTPSAHFETGLGSHRVAVIHALDQLEIDSKLDIPKNINWSEDAPSRFSMFFSRGTSLPVLREAILEQINFERETFVPVLLIWPKAQKFTLEIIETLYDNLQDDLVGIDIELSTKGLKNLIALTYGTEHEWATNEDGIENKFHDTRDINSNKQKVTAIILKPGSSKKVDKLKLEIRKLWNSSFQGVHTTDSWLESLRVFSAISDPFSLAQLENCNLSNQISVISRVSQNLSELISTPTGVMDFVVTGSQWLELFSLRKCNDLDIVVKETSKRSLSVIQNIDLHNEYLKQFGLDINEIIDNPSKHVWIAGCKFIAPEIYLEIMYARKEPKDISFLNKYKKSCSFYEDTVKVFKDNLVYFVTTPSQNKKNYRKWSETFNGPFSISEFRTILDSNLSQTRLISRFTDIIRKIKWQSIRFVNFIKKFIPLSIKNYIKKGILAFSVIFGKR